MKRRDLLAVGLLATVLPGCAEMTGTADADDAIGPALTSYSISGRISLRQGERSDHLLFDWTHGPDHDQVLLASPLGQGVAELSRDAAGARLLQPNQAAVVATDVRALAQQVFGTPLPLDALADWLRGARGWHGEIEGWRLEVKSLAPSRQRRLPKRIEVSRDDVELLLIVDEWGDDE